ncbi:MAG: dimethyl sulfoxide reductase anchor subunit [Verrucomicrobiales bacterium]|nr:dimethyl sulfoxide reductase anchor subunit [Verrucomicrobiales bacterium]
MTTPAMVSNARVADPFFGGASPARPRELSTLVDRYLNEQARLPAVDRFATWHGRSHEATELARIYRARLPATPPSAGSQYAFEVDLDACTGCKACVTACHSLNGLEPEESWRSVGLLVGSPTSSALQHVTTACHHCVDPACLNGCPVLAYEKDAATGIVRHLDDQCIGCSYCTLMCPYEVPRLSKRLGIVRKCDMCHGRLAAGEAPACVQGCPNGAIRIGIVSTRTIPRSPISAAEPTPPRWSLPDSPSPELTRPTTRYVSPSGRPLPTQAADRGHAVPAHAHPPLTLFLVLSQASVGCLWAGWLQGTPPVRLALALQLAALAVASLHLGQPLRAWRAFLGWRRSWFSREVLVFAAYTGVLFASALVSLGKGAGSARERIAEALPPLAIGLGAIGVGTSVMIYASTRRAYWSASATSVRFFGTVVLLGAATLASPGLALGVATAALTIKLWTEARPFGTGVDSPSARRTLRLLAGPLRPFALARALLAVIGLTLLASRGLEGLRDSVGPALAAAVLLAVSEVLERHLFFAAASPERMPGGIPA